MKFKGQIIGTIYNVKYKNALHEEVKVMKQYLPTDPLYAFRIKIDAIQPEQVIISDGTYFYFAIIPEEYLVCTEKINLGVDILNKLLYKEHDVKIVVRSSVKK